MKETDWDKVRTDELERLFKHVPICVIVETILLMHRRSYYPQEKARREKLAAERKAVVVRRTTNPQPAFDGIRKIYFELRRTRGRPVGMSAVLAALRLGALLEDLERFVDNHILVKDGTFGCRGRAGGIKRLFEREAPDLFMHYKSVMRYKALAKRYRQACEAADPIPVEVLLPADEKEEGKIAVGETVFPHRVYLRDAGDLSVWMHDHGNTEYLSRQDWSGRPKVTYLEKDILKQKSLEIASEILKTAGNSLTALKKAISVRIDPECIPPDVHTDSQTSSAAS